MIKKIKNNLSWIVLILLIGAIAVLFFLYKKEKNKNISDEEKNLKEEKKELIVKQDSLNKKLSKIEIDLKKTTDSLRKEEANIKVKYYEQIKYIYRTLDDAVIILDSSKYSLD